ncbi:alpha/beta hydrolase [Cyanobium sp. Morenito 9A2]|uniref:alpha/beta hydrolase n=1 Tax=Cyanobium sp. Morenito 9A2 TaxID=2823718 RepID=UPI0020CC518E|nr:alpha/beta hydrolase [Cyanobium sp. Morenito 9A2]MCP9849969.1 alpha/beta hydrolase [Cyanobium sp. Morenito 9A2]
MRRASTLSLALLGTSLSLLPLPAPAAEQVVFVTGAFRRSISVADLAHLAQTGEARGLLADVIRLSRQQPQTVADLLNRSVSLPLVTTSRLLATRLGGVALSRVARILYPLQAPQAGVPALRAATVLGINAGDGKLSPIGFLQAYPTTDLAVNLPALQAAVSRISGLSSVVSAFLESDLGGKLGGGSGAKP